MVAVGGLLALGAVMAALTLSSPRGGHKRRPARATSGRRELAAHLAGPGAAAGLHAAMFVARRVAERFLAGYLRSRTAAAAHSRSVASRRRCAASCWRQRAQLTPVERRRRPRVVSLQTIGTTPAFVVATAVIDDGGVATYRLRFTLQAGGGRWAVSSVEEG